MEIKYRKIKYKEIKYREIKYREIAKESLKVVIMNLINDNLSGLCVGKLQ